MEEDSTLIHVEEDQFDHNRHLANIRQNNNNNSRNPVTSASDSLIQHASPSYQATANSTTPLVIPAVISSSINIRPIEDQPVTSTSTDVSAVPPPLAVSSNNTFNSIPSSSIASDNGSFRYLAFPFNSNHCGSTNLNNN